MKKLYRFIIIMVIIFSLNNSCNKDDDPFYSVEPYETLLHNHVNNYRKSQGLDELYFFHDVFIEARKQSLAWKQSGDPSTGMNERLQTIVDHWAPSQLGVITSLGFSHSADSAINVVNTWINDSTTRKILLGDYNQSGPGIAYGDGGLVYITHFFLNTQN